MKNFKKVLALVLVVATLLSFASIASATFTDAATVTKGEAVDVLTALGVIGGYTDGSFKPTGDVTRAEMAKMIAFIMNDGEDVGALYSGACTFTDSAKHWAAGYIAYCAQEGIINGKSETKFDPDGKVTGTEAAKMLLGALGYDVKQEGLVGASWASNALSLAKKTGIVTTDTLEGVVLSAPLNRECAAQMLLNALKGTEVEYTGGTNVSTGSTVIKVDATRSNVVQTAARDYAGALAATVAGSTQQLCETHFPKLTLAAGGADAFGRTGNTWKLAPSGDIGTYAVAPTLVYTDVVTGGALYTDLGKVKGTDITNITYFEDGKAVPATVTALTNKIASGNQDGFGHTGAKTEVYYDDVANTLNVVVINTYVAKIANVVDAVKDSNGDIATDAYVTISTTGLGTTAKAGTKPAGAFNTTVELANGGTITATAAVASTAFTRADMNKTIVLYTASIDGNDKINVQSVEKAASVTGTVNSVALYNGNSTGVTMDSKYYKVSENASGYNTTIAQYDTSATVYTDANGLIVLVDAVVSDNYAYVMGTAAKTSFSTDLQAQLLFADGKVEIVDLTADMVAATVNNKVVTYTVTSDGKYALTPDATSTKVTGAMAVKNGTPAMTGVTNCIANANTKFVFGSTVNAVTTYTAYTGIAAVPSYTTSSTQTYAYAYNATTGAANVVFVLDGTATGTTGAAVGMIVKSLQEAATTDATGTYYTVKAVIDGNITTVKVEAALYGTLAQGVNLFNTSKLDTYGYYSAASFTASADQKVAFGGTNAAQFAAYDAGNVTFKTGDVKYVASDVKTFVYNKATDTIAASTIDAVYSVSGTLDSAYTTTTIGDTTTVTGVYAVVDA